MKCISWLTVSMVMPKHEVVKGLVVTAHADIADAELILQPPIDALVPCALDIATLFKQDETEGPPCRLLLPQRIS